MGLYNTQMSDRTNMTILKIITKILGKFPFIDRSILIITLNINKICSYLEKTIRSKSHSIPPITMRHQVSSQLHTPTKIWPLFTTSAKYLELSLV